MADVLLHVALHAPLLLAWCVAMGVAAWMVPRRPPAAGCLMVAAVLEVVRLLLNALSPFVVQALADAGVDFALLSALLMVRSGVLWVVLIVSHLLLLTAIYGWREPVPDPLVHSASP